MTRNWLLPLGLAATTALAAAALPAAAHESGRGDGNDYPRMHGQSHGYGGDAHGGMMDMMRSMHGMSPGMMGGTGMMGGPGHMGEMMRVFDADGDGTLTADELRSGLEDRLAQFDADDSGSLSLDEFEALHSAMIRETMVDRFQMLDNDGDGAVTAGEMTAPADRMERAQERHGRMPMRMPGTDGRQTPPAPRAGSDDGGTTDGAVGDDTEDDDSGAQ